MCWNERIYPATDCARIQARIRIAREANSGGYPSDGFGHRRNGDDALAALVAVDGAVCDAATEAAEREDDLRRTWPATFSDDRFL